MNRIISHRKSFLSRWNEAWRNIREYIWCVNVSDKAAQISGSLKRGEAIESPCKKFYIGESWVISETGTRGMKVYAKTEGCENVCIIKFYQEGWSEGTWVGYIVHKGWWVREALLWIEFLADDLEKPLSKHEREANILKDFKK